VGSNEKYQLTLYTRSPSNVLLTSANVVGKQQTERKILAQSSVLRQLERKAGQFSGRHFWATELASACVLSTLTAALLDTVHDTIIQDLPV